MPNSIRYVRACELLKSASYAEAFHLFQTAAKEGSVDALVMMGNMYARAQGVERNYPEAERCYREASDMGSASGQYNLARMYETGVVFARKRDGIEALRLYKLSAAQGYSKAVEKVESIQYRMSII